MSRNITIILALALLMILSVTVTITASANDKISVIVNDKPLHFDTPAIIIEGRTLVPLRAIFEALGAKVDWNADTRNSNSI